MQQKATIASLATLALLIFPGMQSALAISNGQSKTINNAAFSSQAFELVPVFDIKGYMGHQNIGEGDSLIPLAGDSSQIWYLDAEGKIGKSNNGWMAGLGSGYRKVISDMIFGGYLMVDYSASPTNKKFWIANPGLEALTKSWDFRTNFYIPVGKDSWVTRSQRQDFADKLGDNDFVRFAGHTEFDRIAFYEANTREEASFGLGVDAEIGREIPIVDGFKAYVGGYHFNTKDNGDINGASGRITYQVNNYVGIEAIDTYDKCRHNTAMIGIKLSLGGLGKDAQKQFGISGRLVDPIEHNIATSANGYAVPITTKSTSKIISIGKEDLIEHDNIWFFKPVPSNNTSNIKSAQNLNAVEGDGTYENPFIGLTQDNFNAINPHIGTIDPYPLMYFAPGSYNLENVGFPTNGRFGLPNGWGMFGRTSNYIAPAVLSDRAQFLGGIDLIYDSGAGTAKTTLDSIIIANQLSGINNAALFMQNAADVVLQNSEVQNSITLDSAAIYGMYSDNSSLLMNSSSITALSAPTTGDALAYAADLVNNSNLTLGDTNIISASAHGGISGDSSNAASHILNIDNSVLNVTGNNNTLSSEAIAGTAEMPGAAVDDANAIAYGLYANNNASINISGNYNNFVTIAHGGTSTASVATNVIANVNATSNGIILDNDSSINIDGNYNSFTTSSIGGIGSAVAGTIAPLSSSANVNAVATTTGFNLTNSSMNINGSNNSFLTTAIGGITTSFANSPFGGFSISDAHANATGFYFLSSSLNINGNNNNIETDALNNTASAVSQGGPTASVGVLSIARAIANGFYLEETSVIIKGNNNIISASASGGIATGDTSNTNNAVPASVATAQAYALNPFYNDSVIIQGNGNSINASALGGTSITTSSDNAFSHPTANSSATAEGVVIYYSSNVDISGNNNSIDAIATGGTASSTGVASESSGATSFSDANATANAVYCYDATIEISGNGNSIAATANGGTAISSATSPSSSATVNATATSNAFMLTNDSSLNISGNSTVVSATAIGGTTSASADNIFDNAASFAAGLSLNNSSAIISGNSTIISSSSTGGLENGVAADGTAYGANVVNGSILDFKSTATNTQINVNGSTTSTGIFADALSHLQIDGVDDTTLSDFTNLITFTKISGSGYKIDWGANKLNW